MRCPRCGCNDCCGGDYASELSAMKAERDALKAECDLIRAKHSESEQDLSDALDAVESVTARAEAAEARLKRAEECIEAIYSGRLDDGSYVDYDVNQAVKNYRAADAGKGVE